MTDVRAELDSTGARLEGVERVEEDDRIEWRRSGRAFAVLEGSTGSFLLAPAVAQAALRTPGTAPSPRGRDWVALDVGQLDRFTVDRARAWFVSAWRAAGSRPGRRGGSSG